MDKHSSIPLHIQVRNEILSAIQSGHYKAGEVLPSERELQKAYGVSRLTIRHAISEMERKGLLYSRPGKGRYVSPNILEQQLVRLSGFTEEIKSIGLTASSKVLIQEIIPAPLRVASHLEIAPGAMVVRVKRLRFVAGSPMAIEDAWLPHSLCPDLLDQDLETGSIYAYLNKKELNPTRAVQSLKPDMPAKAERELLCISSRTPVLRMQRTTQSQEARPIEYVESVYRGDRYQFTVVLMVGENTLLTRDVINR